MDPARLAKAKQAYAKDLARNEPQLIDDQGGSNAQNPFITGPDGSTYFSNWTDAENRNSAQNAWFDSKDSKGNTVRRPSWQAFPEYTYGKSMEQFDYITQALKNLQGEGFTQMNDMYKNAMSNIG